MKLHIRKENGTTIFDLQGEAIKVARLSQQELEALISMLQIVARSECAEMIFDVGGG